MKGRAAKRHCARSWLAFIAALGLPLLVAAGDENLDGLTIVSIRFQRYDVFDTRDEKTSSTPYRWANTIHIVSKEDFLRSMLLFEEGDPYSARLAAESARILRQRHLMNPVDISGRRVPEGVVVTVTTHDHWSLRTGGQLSVIGNRTDLSFDFEEDNLIGWGKGVSLAYASNHERNAWSYRYLDPNLFGTRWSMDLVHSDLTDGTREELMVSRPFYSLSAPWSAGVQGQSEELTEHLYASSRGVVSGRRHHESVRVWGGIRLPGNGRVTRRLLAGWEHRVDLYSDWQWIDGEAYPEPEDLVVNGPSLVFEQVADNYRVVTGFQSWDTQEDVSLGPDVSFGVTYSSPTFGGDRSRLLFEGRARVGRRAGDWLLLGDGWFSGRFDDVGAQNAVAGLRLGAAQLGTRGWQLRLLAETSSQLTLDRQLALGADTGLRGWDPDHFDGTGRAVLNVQWRTLLKRDLLGLVSVGVLLFADSGTTWAPRIGPGTGGLRFDAGVGLLLDLSHLSRTSLVQISAGVPDDRSGITFIVSTSSVF
jgi:hypothetical protein